MPLYLPPSLDKRQQVGEGLAEQAVETELPEFESCFHFFLDVQGELA